MLQTSSALSVFMLAMVLHSKIQQKAQAEIDEVLQGSLPTFEDRYSLPYVTALVKEVLRWKPAVPFGLYYESGPSSILTDCDDRYTALLNFRGCVSRL